MATIPALPRMAPIAPPLNALFLAPIPAPLPKAAPFPSPFLMNQNQILKKKKKKRKIKKKKKMRKKLRKPASIPKAPLLRKALIPAPIPKPAPFPFAIAPLPKAPLPQAAPFPFDIGVAPLPNAAPLPSPFPFVFPPMPPLPNAAPFPFAPPLQGMPPLPPMPPLPNMAPLPNAPPLFPFGAPFLPPPLPNHNIHIPIPAPIPMPRVMVPPPIPHLARGYPDEAKDIDDNSYLLFDESTDDEKMLPKSSDYAVNYNHVKTKVCELTENIKATDDACGDKILDIFDKIEVTKDDLSMWVRWSGGSFPDKASARASLKTVIDYAEKKPSSPLIKQQLRVITKLMIDKGLDRSDEYVHFILLLATHGKVCNVMKDISINNAYGMMTQSLTEIIKQQTLENILLRELRDYRHILVEKMHLMFKFGTNQHTVNGFYNVIAPLLGLVQYVDKHLGRPGGVNAKHYKINLHKRFFHTLYNKENITKRIYLLIEEKKIGYQKIVQCLEQYCPQGMDKMEFLQRAINIDNGKINEDYLCWLLAKLNIFGKKSAEWKCIGKCWDDIK